MNNEIVINLSVEDLETALECFNRNSEYLNLQKNVFSIKYITTCFQIEKLISNTFENSDKRYFKFSYNDGNIKNVFRISVDLNDDTSYRFLKNNNFIDDSQLYTLVQKIYQMLDGNKEYNISSLSNDLYNEALIFATSGINKEECKSIKDDFESKYKAFISKQREGNEYIISLINKLYNKLISVKTN